MEKNKKRKTIYKLQEPENADILFSDADRHDSLRGASLRHSQPLSGQCRVKPHQHRADAGKDYRRPPDYI